MKRLTVHPTKKWLLLIGILLILLIGTSIAVFNYLHPTHPKYNDRFIIGNTVDEIIERYGEPNRINFGNKAEAYEAYKTPQTYEVEDISSIEYKVRDRQKGWLDSIPPQYYVIVFENGDGIATRVALRTEDL